MLTFPTASFLSVFVLRILTCIAYVKRVATTRMILIKRIIPYSVPRNALGFPKNEREL